MISQGAERKGGIKDGASFVAWANGRAELLITLFSSSQAAVRTDTDRLGVDLTKFEGFLLNPMGVVFWEVICKAMIILVQAA